MVDPGVQRVASTQAKVCPPTNEQLKSLKLSRRSCCRKARCWQQCPTIRGPISTSTSKARASIESHPPARTTTNSNSYIGPSTSNGIQPNSLWLCLTTTTERRREPAFEWSLLRSSSLISLPLCLMFLLLLPIVLELVTQKCVCLDRHSSYKPLLSMEPTGSIFGSLLGYSNNNNNINNNGNSAAQLQQGPQSAADLHQSYKDGQTSDKVTLPGDILLGGLFPIHMKGK